ncbi:MAG TPA: homoserine dehydrogenase [Anaerolineales bacterium]|nr:homoserine dehydrogenase [Anaerolineales bacterium]HMX20270.1 homoserine dehydrogenase [Anaerolineales bacterium]HMX75946.1 homoserine dehydrogenase [Anaerolineales bacterium]HMZ44315.1 homoserine dehydrogenase [Anaerolineales bacterium]HNA55944.1 homoserine dehydrogenase [Anaerolineales bacterium]
MKHYKLALIGFGNVARALARLLVRKQSLLEQQGITFSFTGISTGRHGFAVNPDGLDIQKALELTESGQSISSLSTTPVADSLAVIKNSSANVMFENSPVNTETGQPALDHMLTALNLGMHAITANKGPVVHGFSELNALADKMGKKFRYESTILGGSPVFSVLREAFPLAEVSSFKGIFNATTNLILSRMENGETYEDAVKYAQSIGVAEADPTNDVDGWDAAFKVSALVRVLWNTPMTPQQVKPTGIRGITSEMIAKAKAEGKRYKLVCFGEKDGDAVKVSVSPQLVDATSPLYGMMNSSTGVTFRTDVILDYSIILSEKPGMQGGPVETAYGLFADFVNIVK